MSTILLISPEPWNGHFVSKHHYARELARRGHRVLFHGPPDDRGGMRISPVNDTPGKLMVLHAPRVAPGLRFMPGQLRRSLEARWLAKVEKLTGFCVDVIWNFENSRFFDMGFAGRRLKIYHQVDLNQNFRPDLAAQTADLTIAISGPIASRIAASARRMVRITHGHAVQCTSPASRPSCPSTDTASLEDDFTKATSNAVLIGNLDISYLDVALLAQLVAEFKETRFHFIGSFTPSQGLHAATADAPNVRFWGSQPALLLPEFLQRADVLLIAYLAEEYLDQLANPHKMMEYLAVGRCVLATRTLEYEGRADLVETACDRDDYVRRFGAIVTNPGAWNCPEKVAIRQSFAANNTYPHQVDRIAKALGPCGDLIS